MLKSLILSAVVASSLFGLSAVSAQAAPSASDCRYYQELFDQGAGGSSSHGNNNFYATALQSCPAK